MKIFLITLTFFLSTFYSTAQNLDDGYYNLNFEDPNELQHLIIDPITNKNNLWQVGSINKNNFTAAHSNPNVIVTDRTNPYPINDTSIFKIINVASWQAWSMMVNFSGYYNVNSDTLTDYGTIEISFDHGNSWIDLINNTTYSQYIYWNPKPVLSGNSNGWKYFSVSLAPLGQQFNVKMNDTIYYQFKFISDNIQTNKDGLMFDDFLFFDLIEGVQEAQNDNLVSIYPNPANEIISINRKESCNEQSMQIFDFTGKLIYADIDFSEESINTKTLNNGVYLLKYFDGKNYSLEKMIVQH